ncbi:MAG: GGDEF domain-containing protein, partial [Bacilli bacterium]|nr:GGDEF domain-containing protein [Bacilli bacterium]
MDVAFALLFIFSLVNDLAKDNRFFYLGAFIYSIIATVFFFVLNKRSTIAQLIIYLSISVLFIFGCFITQNKPSTPAITFIAFLLITPLFMIDRPYFMALELTVASTVFLVWMYFVKDPDTWKADLMNTIIFTLTGILIHVIVNSIRIKEFVLIQQINKQKDSDELTGLANKTALTKMINDFFKNNPNGKGLLFVLDVDYFKSINDSYGHDIGDETLRELGRYLREKFTNNEIVGRFGGDEFIIFFKDVDDVELADKLAHEVIDETYDLIKLPTDEVKFGVSIGAAIYQGKETNYSELFKKADIALYKNKASRKIHYSMYQEE